MRFPMSKGGTVLLIAEGVWGTVSSPEGTGQSPIGGLESEVPVSSEDLAV